MDVFVIDRVRICFLSLEKSMKRLKCACRTKKDRGEAWGENGPKQRGPTQVGIRGVGGNHRYEVQQRFSDNKAFPS